MLARDHAFWDEITRDVTEYVRKCATCQHLQRDPPQELLSEEEDTLTCPWMYVASELFQLKGKDYFIIADSYSRYFYFVKLSSTTSEQIIAALKRGKLGSPVQSLMGRSTRMLLPTNEKLLLPALVKGVAKNLMICRPRDRDVFNKHKTLLPKLAPRATLNQYPTLVHTSSRHLGACIEEILDSLKQRRHCHRRAYSWNN
ncbi:hypothetical protein PR048_017753, partial [Dryococelus australis]